MQKKGKLFRRYVDIRWNDEPHARTHALGTVNKFTLGRLGSYTECIEADGWLQTVYILVYRTMAELVDSKWWTEKNMWIDGKHN
jgi:hypothetical protein